MGCAPTNRKQMTTPAGQAGPVNSSSSPYDRNLTSIDMDRHDDKENRNQRVGTSTKIVTKSAAPTLSLDDMVIKDERRTFNIEKMDFANREHLEPNWSSFLYNQDRKGRTDGSDDSEGHEGSEGIS